MKKVKYLIGMNNIYDIRKDENLLFILPDNRKDRIGDSEKAESVYNNLYFGFIDKKTESLIYDQCAVFVNLYYPDTVNRYMNYLNGITEDIQIHVYSSNERTLKEAQKLQKRSNILYYLKENRGRDITTLLIAARKTLLQYKYVCFLHDKKANADYLKDDVDIWIDNLWGNTIGSAQYIDQVLQLLENNSELGLLVPPEGFGTYISHWCGDTWLADYPLCKALAENLQLNTDMTEDKLPFTIGTVFWAKTQALRTLLEKNWAYTDFPEEPMPIDGTISHAVEKILGYTAQDAGYKTGTIMSDQYASWLLLSAQEHMRTMFLQLQKREHIHNMAQIINLDEREKMLEEFCERYVDIYIYGAGNYGRSIYHFVKDRGWQVRGFVVSTHKRTFLTVQGMEVFEIQELEVDEKTGIIIGVSYEYREAIETILDSLGFKNYVYGF